MKSCKKAVRRRNNRERPQNRHLRPWKKGDPNIPKSPGRPRTVGLFAELGAYLVAHEDTINEYLNQRIGGKKRIHRLFDLVMKRRPELILYAVFGKPR